MRVEIGVRRGEGKEVGGGVFVEQKKKVFAKVRCCDLIIADNGGNWNEKNLPVPTKARTNRELGMMNPRLNRLADLTPAFHHEC